MTHAEAFLAEVEAFLERSKMPASEFGKAAVNDRSLVRDLRAGRMPSLRLVDRVHDFIRSQASEQESAA